MRASTYRSIRLQRKKWAPRPRITIREPAEDDKEDKWGKEEEKGEDEEGKTSGLGTTENHCQGAAHSKPALVWHLPWGQSLVLL